MKKIELLDKVIKTTKKNKELDPQPSVFIKTPKGLTISILCGLPKYAMKMSLFALLKIYNNPEMVLIIDAWVSKSVKDLKKVIPSKDPNRKEARIISYFSPNKCATHVLIFEKENKNLIWKEEMNYFEQSGGHNDFNPYTFKKEDVERWVDLLKRDEIRGKGKKTEHKLHKNFVLNVYKYKEKVFFEGLNHKKEIFIKSKVIKDNKEFNEKLNYALSILKPKTK